MKYSNHSVNSSKNLLLDNNNHTESLNETYSHITGQEDTQNFQNQINKTLIKQSNSENNKYNLNTTIKNNSSVFVNNNSFLMSNNSFSLNNISTRNLLGNTNMNQMRSNNNQLINTSFNNFNSSPTSPNVIRPILPSSANQSINPNINLSMSNNINTSFNNISSSNIKILNALNTMDIPQNKSPSSPPVPPVPVGKEDSDYEEEGNNQMVIVIDPSTMLLPVNEIVNTTPDPRKIPNSVEDWINYHAAIEPDKKFLPPDEPPSKIPILESTIPLDEVLTPQRSVSCRIRLLQQQRRKKAQELAEQEKYIQQQQQQTSANKSLNMMSTDAIIYSSPSIQIPSAIRSNRKIKTDISNIRTGSVSRYNIPKAQPKFQLCTYKKCEWIATNKCEKCGTLCCLDHSNRFYYFFPSLFSPKYYCPKCMKAVTMFWKWTYIAVAIVLLGILIIGVICRLTNNLFKTENNIVFSLFCILLIALIIVSFSFSYMSSLYTDKSEKERLLLD